MGAAAVRREALPGLIRRVGTWVVTAIVVTVCCVNVSSLTRERVVPLFRWLPKTQCAVQVVGRAFPAIDAHVPRSAIIDLSSASVAAESGFESRVNLLLPSGGAGDRIHMVARAPHSNEPIHVNLVSPRWLSTRARISSELAADSVWQQPVEGVLFTGLGMLVLWRMKPDRRAALLALFLLTFGLQFLGWFSSLPVHARVAMYAFLEAICRPIAFLALYLFIATSFSRSRWFPVAASTWYMLAGVLLLVVWPVSLLYAVTTGCFMPTEMIFSKLMPFANMSQEFGLALVLLGLWLVTGRRRSATAEMQARNRWITFGTRAFCVVSVAGWFVAQWNPGSLTYGVVLTYGAFGLGLLLFVLFAYAVVIDKAVDMDVVYPKFIANAVVGLILTAIFTWFEESAIRYLEQQSFPEIFVIQFLLIGTTGILFALAHRRVDGLVEHMLFFEKREARRRFWTFLQSVDYYEDNAKLMEQGNVELERALGSACVAAYRFDTSGITRISACTHPARYPISVPATDSAVASLRSTSGTVALHDIASSELGDRGFAAPISRRGRFLGAIAYADRTDGEPYDDNDHNMVLTFARQIAQVLDAADTTAAAVAALGQGGVA